MFECKKCQLRWSYKLEKCIFCGSLLDELVSKERRVKGLTKVLIPSIDHPKVPYNCLLLEDEFGNFSIKKTIHDLEIGDVVDLVQDASNIEVLNVGVVGTGATGTGIAQVFAEFGHNVIVKSRSESSLNECFVKIEKSLLKSRDVEDVKNIMGRLKSTLDFGDLSDADLIVEAVSEDFALKCDVFDEISKLVSSDCILATNTSSLSINSLAEGLANPERFLGMHFFNPVPKMALVEVVVGDKTSDETVKQVVDLAKGIAKVPIKVVDSPAFIVNRVLMVYLNEAIEALEEGIATPEEIDSASKLGLNYPMGPLELADFIGLDIVYAILSTMFDKTGKEKYRPVKMLVDKVGGGKLGRKTKQGFYSY